MKPWKRIEPTTVTKIGWRTVVTKTFELPNGEPITWDTQSAEGEEVVIVLALTKENKVILARQFRPGPERVLDELPAGFVDKGESPEQAARRELQEETGYVPGNIKSLGKMHRDAYSNLTIHPFFVTDCALHERGQQLDDVEYIEVDLVSIDQLLKNAKTNLMIDVGVVFLAYDELQKLRSK